MALAIARVAGSLWSVGKATQPPPTTGTNSETLMANGGNGVDDGMGRAQCTNRKCGIGFFDDRESAIEKWNRRAS